MELIDQIEVNSNEGLKLIQLFYGDLTNLPKEEAVDFLIVSAIPGSYYPSRGTLIDSLDKKSIELNKLAKNIKYDYRKEFSCWLSQKINHKEKGIEFDHILVFEPFNRGSPGELVGDIFRALIPFLSHEINKVATPLVSTGAVGSNPIEIMENLVEFAYYWMLNGLQLQVLKIVINQKPLLNITLPSFQTFKYNLPKQQDQAVKIEKNHDIFISYSHKNSKIADFIFTTLKSINSNLRIYMDKLELNTGASWQQEIFISLEKSKFIFALLSPDYLKSKVCIEEFDIAMIKNREANAQVLFPLLIENTELPMYMRMIQYLNLINLDPSITINALNSIIKQLNNQYIQQSTSLDYTKKSQTLKIDNNQLIQIINQLKHVYLDGIPISRLSTSIKQSEITVLEFVEALIISGELQAKIKTIHTGDKIHYMLNFK